MTRINSGIHPFELPDKLLLAELREIKRVPNVVRSGRYNMANQPLTFTLGQGHVKFFYDKLLFLKKRYLSLYNEAISRGFNVQDFSSAFDNCPLELMNDYIPKGRDRTLITERIESKGFKLKSYA